MMDFIICNQIHVDLIFCNISRFGAEKHQAYVRRSFPAASVREADIASDAGICPRRSSAAATLYPEASRI